MTQDRVLGFHFHPIMGRYSVDDPALAPLFEAIKGLVTSNPFVTGEVVVVDGGYSATT